MSVKSSEQVQTLLWAIKRIAEQLESHAAVTHESCDEAEEDRLPTEVELTLLTEQAQLITTLVTRLSDAVTARR